MTCKWIDISMTLRNGMICWPGDPPFKRKLVKNISKGDSCNLSGIEMGTHSGTHLDAPLHFLGNGRSIDEVAPEVLIGTARVISIKDKRSISLAELKKKRIRKGERILFKTRNSSLVSKDKFVKDYVCISIEAAKHLKEKALKLVGIDYLSVGGFAKTTKSRGVHKTILNSGAWIIEGLDLSQVEEGKHFLICLPLKIEDAEGAPARCLLRRQQ